MPDPQFLTCLVCGPYAGGDQPVHGPGPGWVMSGGIGGALQTCSCCKGHRLGHPVEQGVPECQNAAAIFKRRAWRDGQVANESGPMQSDLLGSVHAATLALATYEAEASRRTYAALCDLYGPTKAAEMMEVEPPL